MLLGPVKRQIEFGQTRRSELDGLPALEDRFDQLWAQERNVNEAPNVAPGDAIAVGQILERSGAASGQLLKPRATTGAGPKPPSRACSPACWSMLKESVSRHHTPSRRADAIAITFLRR